MGIGMRKFVIAPNGKAMPMTPGMDKAMWTAYAAGNGIELDARNMPRDIRDARTNVSTDVALIDRGLRLTSDKIVWEGRRVNKLTEEGQKYIAEELNAAWDAAIIEDRERQPVTVKAAQSDDAPQGHPDGICGDWTCPECGTPEDAPYPMEGRMGLTAKGQAKVKAAEIRNLRGLSAGQVAYLGMAKTDRTAKWNHASLHGRAGLMVAERRLSDAWDEALAYEAAREQTKAAQLAYLKSIPGRVICVTWDCDAPATMIVTLTGNPPAIRTEHCRQHADALSESPFFASMEPIRLSIGPTPVADLETDDASLVAACLASQARADREAEKIADRIGVDRSHVAPAPADDSRRMAEAMRGRTASTWTADDCDHVPPMVNCWCSLLGTPVEPSSPDGGHTWAEGMCRSMESLCVHAATVRLHCCGVLVCSTHAASWLIGPCGHCGSVMSAPLAEFDAALATLDRAIDLADDLASSIESDGPDDLASFPAGSRASVKPTIPAWPRFGVHVEWWDDRSVKAVIGSYDTWEQAAHEVERLKRLGRFEYVHGIIALYGSETDV